MKEYIEKEKFLYALEHAKEELSLRYPDEGFEETLDIIIKIIKKDTPIVKLNPSCGYKYCPWCGKKMEVDNGAA